MFPLSRCCLHARPALLPSPHWLWAHIFFLYHWIVEDVPDSSHLNHNGAIAQRVAQRDQPGGHLKRNGGCNGSSKHDDLITWMCLHTTGVIIIIIIRNTKYNSTIASDVLQCNIVNKDKEWTRQNKDNELEPTCNACL